MTTIFLPDFDESNIYNERTLKIIVFLELDHLALQEKNRERRQGRESGKENIK